MISVIIKGLPSVLQSVSYHEKTQGYSRKYTFKMISPNTLNLQSDCLCKGETIPDADDNDYGGRGRRCCLGQQASNRSSAVIWTSAEPALMMELIHVSLLHYESHT